MLPLDQHTNAPSSILPLSIVLLITLFKNALEDYKRHVQDRLINNQRVLNFNWENGRFEWAKWQDLEVGQFVIIN